MSEFNPYRSPKMETGFAAPHDGVRTPLPILVMIPRCLAIILCSTGLAFSLVTHGELICGTLILLGVALMFVATVIGRRMGAKPRPGRARAGWAAAILLIVFGSSMIVSGSFRQSLTQKRIAELEATKSHFESMASDGWGLK